MKESQGCHKSQGWFGINLRQLQRLFQVVRPLKFPIVCPGTLFARSLEY